LTLGIVVGMRAEARLAKRLGGVVAIGGGTRAGAQEAAEELVTRGCRALLSFGVAGGLDPTLEPGRIVIPSWVHTGGHHIATDASLGAALGGLGPEVLAGAIQVLADAAAKQRLHQQSGAVAVDLESGAVAQVATRFRLPFAVLRVVCDPADRSLPPIALQALSKTGGISIFRVAISALIRPWQVPALLRLGADARAAHAALAQHVRKVGKLV
jgi:adenosylhomocysteine nucleosidase